MFRDCDSPLSDILSAFLVFCDFFPILFDFPDVLIVDFTPVINNAKNVRRFQHPNLNILYFETKNWIRNKIDVSARLFLLRMTDNVLLPSEFAYLKRYFCPFT